MADLIESARGILSNTERRMEAAANNVANMTAPGFKSQRLYSDVSAGANQRAPEVVLREHSNLDQGRLSKTDNPLDLAIAGVGMFRLRSADGSIAYTRSGQFRILDGRLVSAQGMALEDADGGDIPAPSTAIRIEADGTVLDGDRPIARIALFSPVSGTEVIPLGGSLFAIPDGLAEQVREPQLRQGMVEGSNVSLAEEMVGMMDALRQAEGGARLVQAYDDLIGRAITTLGQGGR